MNSDRRAALLMISEMLPVEMKPRESGMTRAFAKLVPAAVLSGTAATGNLLHACRMFSFHALHGQEPSSQPGSLQC